MARNQENEPMGKASEKGPISAQGEGAVPPLPEYSEEHGDAQVQTLDGKWALQMQRRGREVYLAIGSIGPAFGRPEGFALYVNLFPPGLEYLYRWLTEQAGEMKREGVVG